MWKRQHVSSRACLSSPIVSLIASMVVSGATGCRGSCRARARRVAPRRAAMCVCVASRSGRSGRRRRQIALSFGDGSDEPGGTKKRDRPPLPQHLLFRRGGGISSTADARGWRRRSKKGKNEPPPLLARGLFLKPSFLSSRALGAPRTNLVVEVLDQTPERHARVRGGPVGRVDARQLRVLAGPAREWRLLLSA